LKDTESRLGSFRFLMLPYRRAYGMSTAPVIATLFVMRQTASPRRMNLSGAAYARRAYVGRPKR